MWGLLLVGYIIGLFNDAYITDKIKCDFYARTVAVRSVLADVVSFFDSQLHCSIILEQN